MQKIKAFFIALLLSLVFMFAVHILCLHCNLKVSDSSAFGLWYNTYKNMSYYGLSANLRDDTMMVFGSSEFRHGLQSSFHPRNLFKDRDISLMIIGGPFNQSLNHTVTLGSVSDKLKNKKVVLLVSPTWFRTKKIKSEGFCLRFSETEYIHFLKNKNIPGSVKKYVAKRAVKLLKSDKSKQDKVKVYNRVLLENSRNIADRLRYRFYSSYATDRDVLTTDLAIHRRLKKSNKKQPETDETDEIQITGEDPLDWDKLYEDAYQMDKDNSHNQMFMTDKYWNSTFASRYKRGKDMHGKDDLTVSDEYGDLKAFLKLCQAQGLKPELIVLPINGYWYDYTGIGTEKRKAFQKKIKEIASAYGATLADLSKYDYDRYITQDAVHPSRQGWLRINETIYDYYYNKD